MHALKKRVYIHERFFSIADMSSVYIGVNLHKKVEGPWPWRARSASL